MTGSALKDASEEHRWPRWPPGRLWVTLCGVSGEGAFSPGRQITSLQPGWASGRLKASLFGGSLYTVWPSGSFHWERVLTKGSLSLERPSSPTSVSPANVKMLQPSLHSSVSRKLFPAGGPEVRPRIPAAQAQGPAGKGAHRIWGSLLSGYSSSSAASQVWLKNDSSWHLHTVAF